MKCDKDRKKSPVLLDELLLELGCFDKPCRPESLERICKLAVQPEDPTAKIIIGKSSNNNGSTSKSHIRNHEIQNVLARHSQSNTLFLHNFVESSSSSPSTEVSSTTDLPPRKRSRRSSSSFSSLSSDLRKPLRRMPTTLGSSSSSSSLKQLCLSHCTVHADTIQFLAESKQLQTLIVWNCTVRRGLENLTSLEALVLVDCCIAEVPLQRIVHKSLTLLRFALIRSGNLPNLQRRTSYYVSNPIGFSQALKTTKAPIQKLVVADSMLPDSEFAVTAMSCCNHLQSLSLKSTLISDKFAASLAEALTNENFQKQSSLTELVLSNVRWSPMGAITLANAIRENTTLTKLDISHTLWFGPEPIQALKQMLAKNSSLEQIQLNFLEYSSLLCSLKAVTEGIAENQGLSTVSLAGNHLDNGAMIGLTEILTKHHSTLKNLCVRDCYAPSGWESVLLGLRNNESLEKLSFEDCRIGNIAAETIGTILSTNTTLKSIDLCHNGISDDGIERLVDGLKQNQSLQKVFLHGNDIGLTGAKLLRNTIRDTNHSLRVIFLPMSPLQEEMQYYGCINYAGRKYIGETRISRNLWPTILARSSKQPDMLIYLLQQKPELFQQQQQQHCHRRLAGKKRTREELAI